MSDPNPSSKSCLKGKFKGFLDQLMGANSPLNECPSGSRVLGVTGEGTSLNILQGAHNFVMRDTTFYVAQNIEVHQHVSRGQDDTLFVSQRPNSSAMFTGRKDVLERLKDHFAPEDWDNKHRKLFLLYGMGGIGKTQICLKFAEEVGDRFSHIFWIDASSEATIALGLKGLFSCSDAKVASISVSSQLALLWIASLQSEWLLVFDNADGAPEVVEKFVPSGSKGIF
ncbi:hypothetical protein K443DRAFT_6753 [Laccaria amethystina LaAM-08-1]|uniref:NB-ARC domain-containing protein n=1 Tax=Laccaria amethystina LaAM-08-1 TaxID=1095629 RepID=A0A0C9WSB8_9AGAR|nr:hypothetical protein K443DRAFT_6753 [Laccaria amethystina LaAM-08-1]